MQWTLDAACNGIPTEMFYLEKSVSSNSTEARMVLKLCAGCPVRQQCLDTAMQMEGNAAANHRYGIWGGMTPRQRSRLAKQLFPKPRRDPRFCQKQLHEMTTENTYFDSRNKRLCRACRAASHKRYDDIRAGRVVA